MSNFDYKKYVNNNPLLKEDFPEEYAKAFATATGNEDFDDDIIELRNDPVFIEQYNTEIYVPPHVRGEDVTVRADAENYRLPVEFLVDMAEQFGDMGSDATSFVDETIARFVEVGMAEAEKDKLYNWFDNIMYAQGTMSEGFDFKKYVKNNPLLK